MVVLSEAFRWQNFPFLLRQGIVYQRQMAAVSGFKSE
jgi:hypothetical protein